MELNSFSGGVVPGFSKCHPGSRSNNTQEIVPVPTKSSKLAKLSTIIIVLIVSTVWAGIALPVSAESPEDSQRRSAAPKQISTVEELSRWMTYYYVHPQPDLLVSAVLFADRNNLISGDYVVPLQAFLSRVFAQNPDKIGVWFNELAPMKEANRTLLLTAIWWSNTSQGKQLLQQVAKGLPEKPQAEFKKQIDSDPPLVQEMPIDHTSLLDMLWASYSATGDEKYVKRIMTTLPWSETDQKNLQKMMLASAAKWSLTSNCEQHPKVLEICQKTLSSDASLKKYLEPLLADVEKRRMAATGNTTK